MATRNISIPARYSDVREHLERQPNVSRYICELVRKDMQGSDLESKVREIVENLLKENNYQKNTIQVEDIKKLLDF